MKDFLLIVGIISGITLIIIAIMNSVSGLHLDGEGWSGWFAIIAPVVGFWLLGGK